MTHLMGCAPQKVICFGIVPENINPGMELTDTLKLLVPKIAEMVLKEIKSL